jgi:hypothetical protein
MKVKELIFRFLESAYKDSPDTDETGKSKDAGNISSENKIVRELFDGMSTGTARIVIEKELGDAVAEQYNIDQLENQGRYYLAKIISLDGSPIQRLLVDKQTGTVQLIGQ